MAGRTIEQDEWHARGFASGAAVACAILYGTFGVEVETEEILTSTGLDSMTKLRRAGADEYDIKILAPVLKSLRRQRARARARREAKE